MKRLLLVEDDASLGETLCERLRKESYEVTWARSLEEAHTQAAVHAASLDLIVLDVNLPDGSGFDFAREVRGRSATPFIFITAMNSAEHRLEGYEIGAEEFIPKPFHLKELLLRVRHVLRTHADRGTEIRLASGRVIDLAARTVRSAKGGDEFLAERDFQLLKLLIESAPKAVSRDEILDRVWGEDKYPSHRTVDNAIVRLRQSLGDGDGTIIRSVRGFGYQWVGAGL